MISASSIARFSIAFSIHQNGSVEILQSCNFEPGPRDVRFTVIAIDGGGLSDAADVHITITDINEFSLQFQPFPFQ